MRFFFALLQGVILLWLVANFCRHFCAWKRGEICAILVALAYISALFHWYKVYAVCEWWEGYIMHTSGHQPGLASLVPGSKPLARKS
jgi:hypothetical protein